MGMHSTSHTGVPAKAFPETKTCIPYSLEILGARSPKKPIHKSGPRGPWAGGPQTQPLLRISGTVLAEAGLGKLKQADSPGGKKRQGGLSRVGMPRAEALLGSPSLVHASPPALGLGWAWRPPLGSDPVAIAPNM